MPAYVGHAWRAASAARMIWGGLLLAFVAVLLIVMVRRLSGAVQHPLPVIGFVIVAAAAASIAASMRLCQLTAFPLASATWPQRMLTALPTLALLLLACVLWLPGTEPLGPGLVALMAGIVEAAIWLGRRRAETGRRPIRAVSAPVQSQGVGTITQQWTRTAMPDGGDRITGKVQARLQPGQRTAAVHVPFCPAFSAAPTIVAEQLSGPEARIKVGQIWPHGTRLDIKLAQTAPHSCAIGIKFIAHAAGAPCSPAPLS